MRAVRSRTGKVYLVGAGPGDPDLITVKGLRLLQQADVVVYDRLVDPALLRYTCEECEKIYVGKRGGHYSHSQDAINRLLLDRAERGLKVVRLKGGDPCLYGRGGEEAQFLLNRDVDVEIVSGVSSALAAPAAFGIPLTHRNVASSVAIVSGHQRKHPQNPLDWSRLAQSTDTLVVMMPLSNLRRITSQLILHGRSLTTPAAVIEAGTCAHQRQVVSTLKEIASEVDRAGLGSPSLLVVGEVVRLNAASHELEEAEAPGAAAREPLTSSSRAL